MPTTRTRLEPALLGQAAILLLGIIAPPLDTTIVSVALGRLAQEFGTSVVTVQWVSASYLLALVTAIPATGWAADRFGAKRMWVLALLLFLGGSLLCATAWDIGSLIAFRAVQGTGAGLMLPILQTLLFRAAAGRDLGRLMAVVTLPALIGPILGPVLGSLVVDHASWQMIFLVNAPICVAAAALAMCRLPADAGGRGGHSTSSASHCCRRPPSRSSTGPPAWPRRRTRRRCRWRRGSPARSSSVRHCSPPSSGTPCGRRTRSSSCACSPTAASARRRPCCSCPGWASSGRCSCCRCTTCRCTGPAWSRPVVLLGIALTLAGTIPFALAGSGEPVLAAALVGRGIGMSATNTAVMVAAFGGLTSAQIPHASTLTRIAQQLGGSVGTAVLAVVLQAGSGAGPVAALAGAVRRAVALSALAVVPALLLRAAGRAPDRSRAAEPVQPYRV